MRNIKLTIQYDGTRYAGWQAQDNATAIQTVIEKALKDIVGKKVSLVGSGRTDAGVHASGQVANFKTVSKIPIKNVRMALNSALPKDIVITRVEEAGPGFNSQRGAKSKIYRYTISNGNFVDPFIRNFAARCFYKLNPGAMRRASKFLAGRHDFRAFKTNDGGGERNTVRTIKKISIEKEGNLVYIYIEADGFLYNMARSIVGTLIEVGRGKMDEERVKMILAKKDRRLSGPTMEAKGLCLIRVKY